MKKFILMIILGSFLFPGVSFNRCVTYGSFDEDGVTVTGGFGVDFDLNSGMSLGYDTQYGMLFKRKDLPGGVIFRLGIDNSDSDLVSTIGLGYNWWTGGEAIKTSIGTNLDYQKDSGNTDATTVSINIGWGI